jgi:hypothetical protein
MFPQVSGMRFDYDSQLPPFERVIVESARIHGKPLDPSALYTVTANEGLVMFLQQLGFAISDVQTFEVTAVGAVRALVEQRGVIDAESSRRIRDLAARKKKPWKLLTSSRRLP